MDYEKIGKFISERRKEQMLTQSDIAEKLGITDRAVSRWERGLGCPDISLLEPLSELLKVSVLELLHGEKIENADKVVISMIKKSRKNIRIWKYLALIIINFILVHLISTSVYNFIIPKMIEANKNLGIETVISGGMSPALEVYDRVVYEKEVKMEDIKKGNIIAIYSPNVSENEMEKYIIFHRVVDIYKDENGNIEFITKGDNNIFNDLKPITKEMYLGRFKHVFVGQARKYFNNNGDMPTLMFICFMIAEISIVFLDVVQIKKIVNKKVL